MITTLNLLTQALVASYATGWVQLARRAKRKKFIDLCQLIRTFIFSPFVFASFAAFVVVGIEVIILCIIPNLLWICTFIGGIILVSSIIATLGYFVVAPAVKKTYGIAKPFSDKLCIPLYKK